MPEAAARHGEACTHVGRHTHIYRHIDRQTYIHTERQTYRTTDIQTYSQAGILYTYTPNWKVAHKYMYIGMYACFE